MPEEIEYNLNDKRLNDQQILKRINELSKVRTYCRIDTLVFAGDSVKQKHIKETIEYSTE